MPVPQSTKWIQKAFLHVEGELLKRIANNKAHNFTEETLRDQLFQGLLDVEPDSQGYVVPEEPVQWHDKKCFCCVSSPGSGRKKSHDVVVKAFSRGGDNFHGLACEVKWLKCDKKGHAPHRQAEIIADVLRLALTRESKNHGKSIKTFLLVGGESRAFSGVLKMVLKEGMEFRWAPSGNQTSIDGRPRDKTVVIRTLLRGSEVARDELRDCLSFNRDNQEHHREVGAIWNRLRISLRARWLQTIEDRSWRMALWEISSWGCDASEMPQADLLSLAGIQAHQ